MFSSFRHLLGWIISAFYSRQDLILENLALRGQLLALHAKQPRHRLSARQKMFWVLLQRLWSGWKAPLVLVTPQTVVQWHRAGFRLYWKWLSRTRQVSGRKPISQELRALIFRMGAENPTWVIPWQHRQRLSSPGDLPTRAGSALPCSVSAEPELPGRSHCLISEYGRTQRPEHRDTRPTKPRLSRPQDVLMSYNR